MSKQIDPEELRRLRRERRNAKNGTATVEAADRASSLVPVEDVPDVAQGRAQAMVRLQDLPEIIDAPEADGPLTADEEERWELCKRSFSQYRDAWWVAAKALNIALRGRLWRRDYAYADDFIREVAGMSTSNAYRQIAGAEVAAILAGQAAIELESNGESRMRDSEPSADGVDSPPLVISQRAAEALTPIREDYGPEGAATAYRTVVEASESGRVSGKVIAGIVQQIPRRAVEYLDDGALRARVRELAAAGPEMLAGGKGDPVEEFAAYVQSARQFASKTRGMASSYRRAAKADQARADRLAERLRDHLRKAAQNFPDV